MKDEYVSSEEAIRLLKISKSTLYSYVSRGLLHSVEKSRADRTKKYLLQDIERLIQKKNLRSQPEKITTHSLQWGEPVIETAISYMDEKTFLYRGFDVENLARERQFEEVIALLWNMQEKLEFSKEFEESREIWQSFVQYDIDTFLMLKSREDLSVRSFSGPPLFKAAKSILFFLLYKIGGVRKYTSIGQFVCDAYDKPPTFSRFFNSVLILSAESELNIASFTARCSASAGVDLYASIQSALISFRGRRHGGNIFRIIELFDDAGNIKNLGKRIQHYLRGGRRVPGFGHQIFTLRDPRAEFIFTQLALMDKRYRKEIDNINAIAENLLGGLRPTVDFALVLAEHLLGLPKNSSFDLYFLARLSGWIAHIFEQYEQGKIIRPRAKYVAKP